ncbi:hypothetical protein DK26_21405 [Bosea sp. WAO]|nr:hypothetical protein DK26_21405 [Bosea sp. WAO]
MRLPKYAQHRFVAISIDDCMEKICMPLGHNLFRSPGIQIIVDDGEKTSSNRIDFWMKREEDR